MEILIFIRTLSLGTHLLYEAGFLCGQNRCRKTLLSIYIWYKTVLDFVRENVRWSLQVHATALPSEVQCWNFIKPLLIYLGFSFEVSRLTMSRSYTLLTEFFLKGHKLLSTLFVFIHRAIYRETITGCGKKFFYLSFKIFCVCSTLIRTGNL